MNNLVQKISKEDFPISLTEIPQPPKQLFFRGILPNWQSQNNEGGTKFVVVVGSRKYTNYGKEACEKIISELRGYDIVIVSGLAMGIDSIASKIALQNNLKTIAVPGSGIDEKVIYPSINKKLAEEIVNSGGCLLSEFEPDFKATLWSFPQRNRIMAGLADVILIIEAEEKSGTLITARMGTDYNKEVCVVPASIFSNNSKGSNKLMRQGATPITCGADLLELLGISTGSDSVQNKLNFDDFPPEEKKIIKILTEPMSRDEISRKLQIPINELNPTLSMMEIKGIIKESVGEIYLM